MGMEIKTTARQGRKRFEGKLHLDSNSLFFSSKAFRWSMLLADIGSVEAKNDRLVIKSKSESISFDVGNASSKWIEKILNPPNRIKKLGVKPEHRFWVSSGFAADFKNELRQHGARATRKIESCDIAFWKVAAREDLIKFPDIAEALPDSVNLWIVWPKGNKSIGQTDVMKSAHAHGMGPSKTAAFDEGLSSMRFARKK